LFPPLKHFNRKEFKYEKQKKLSNIQTTKFVLKKGALLTFKRSRVKIPAAPPR